eukprot:TRINITY_DN47571_c0_g1_i1.p1 TRINITY_DN47571_c0_g1~~TRINITY_DN47571_c0_g1_i1.p1  ORF type:complete len:369 (-),score=65.09 TRINITY_DN47571_c0_g1_i1:44-1075(-)
MPIGGLGSPGKTHGVGLPKSQLQVVCRVACFVSCVLGRRCRRLVVGASCVAEAKSLTVIQIKDRLRTLGLPLSGRKAELLARLKASTSNGVTNLRNLTVAQLKKRLRLQGLTVTGRKADLLARLEASMRESGPEEVDVEGPRCSHAILASNRLPEGISLGKRLRGRISHHCPNSGAVYVDLSDAEEDSAVGTGIVQPKWLQASTPGVQDYLQPGREVDAWAVAASSGAVRLNLAVAPPRPRPTDVSSFVAASSSTWHEGRICASMSFGLFVALEGHDGAPGPWGFVPMEELQHSDEPRGTSARKLAKRFVLGQAVQVRVLEADAASDKLCLTMKPPDETPETE